MNLKLSPGWSNHALNTALVVGIITVAFVSPASAQNPVDEGIEITESLIAAEQLEGQLVLLVAGGLLLAAGTVTIISSTTAYLYFNKKVESMLE